MKPSVILRLIVSLVVVIAFVLGATVAEAGNSLNPTALLWAQKQSRLLWIVDGFALLALLPVFASALLQTRLAQKTEEITYLRDQHETQMEDMIQHAEEVERINIQQSQTLEGLEATIDALNARMTAMEADNKARQDSMELETRRLAGEAFAALADEVQTNTRQMEAVSLAMQYQRAEIKQLRQGIRAAQHPYELSEVARLTSYELAALEGDATPLLLEDGEEKKRREDEKTEETLDTKYEAREEENSSFLLPPSSLQEPSTDYAPTMNAQTTFISPATEYEIAYPEAEDTEDGELSAAVLNPAEVQAKAQSIWEELQQEHPVEPDEDKSAAAMEETAEPAVSGEVPAPSSALTPEEYHFLHRPLNSVPPREKSFQVQEDSSSQSAPLQTASESAELPQDEPQSTQPQRGLRRWFMRL